MRYDLIIFDFDGTLADSFPFFVAAQNVLARKHRFREIAPADVDALRHVSPRELMRRVGMSRWRLPFVVRDFTRHMREHGHGIGLFEGVDVALAALHAQGPTLAIVTSNGHDNCRRILGPAFDRFAHLECDVGIFGKKRRLRRVLKAAGVPASHALYVGDTEPDAEAARAAGVDFAAVSWGYGAIEALRMHAPAVVLASVGEIATLNARDR